MTAQFENDCSPIWFFTSTENALVKALPRGRRAIATFASKGHDLFAAVHGSLAVDTDPAVVDRLWNRFVAAWFERGKTDPKLALLRLDAERAEIWQDASSLLSGVKLLMGIDPKAAYKDKVADVPLK
jgi:general stress protein 26